MYCAVVLVGKVTTNPVCKCAAQLLVAVRKHWKARDRSLALPVENCSERGTLGNDVGGISYPDIAALPPKCGKQDTTCTCWWGRCIAYDPVRGRINAFFLFNNAEN